MLLSVYIGFMDSVTGLPIVFRPPVANSEYQADRFRHLNDDVTQVLSYGVCHPSYPLLQCPRKSLSIRYSYEKNSRSTNHFQS